MSTLLARRIEETREIIAAERERQRRLRLTRQIAAVAAKLEKIGPTPPANQREQWFRLFNRIRTLKAELHQRELQL